MPPELKDDFYAQWIKPTENRADSWRMERGTPVRRKSRHKFWLIVLLLLLLIGFRYWQNPYSQQIKDGLSYVLDREWNFEPLKNKVAEITGDTAPALSYQGSLNLLVEGGQIKQKYGWQKSEWEGMERFNSGIVIQAASGSTVKALKSGRVVKIEEVPDLGLVLQLEHEAGFYTLYAGVDFLTLAVGQNIQEGEAVGKVQQEFYLEVRRNYQLIDPLEVLEGVI